MHQPTRKATVTTPVPAAVVEEWQGWLGDFYSPGTNTEQHTGLGANAATENIGNHEQQGMVYPSSSTLW